MSSRRLDISSLLCDDDDQRPLQHPVPDPVILAPHLRNPRHHHPPSHSIPDPKGNLPPVGLDALVHAASQERRRLSAPIPDDRPPSLSLAHWPQRSHVLDDSDRHHHHIHTPRTSPVVDNLIHSYPPPRHAQDRSSVEDGPQDHHRTAVPQTSPLFESRMQGPGIFPTHYQYHARSPTIDTRLSPTTEDPRYPVQHHDKTRSSPVHRTHDRRVGPAVSPVAPGGRSEAWEPAQIPAVEDRRYRSGGYSPQHHHHQQRQDRLADTIPGPQQLHDRILTGTSPSPVADDRHPGPYRNPIHDRPHAYPDVTSPGLDKPDQGRWMFSPVSMSDTRPRKKRRWSNSHSGSDDEGTLDDERGRNTEGHYRRRPEVSIMPRPGSVLGDSQLTISGEGRKLSGPGLVDGRPLGKRTPSDGQMLIKPEGMIEEHAQSDHRKPKDERQQHPHAGLSGIANNRVVHRGHAMLQDQDPHEWLLEHYTEPPPPPPLPPPALVNKISLPTALAHREGSAHALSVETTARKPRKPTPETVTAMKQESEDVAGAGVGQGLGKTEPATDPSMGLVVQTMDADESATIKVDIEHELLNVVDDGLPVLPHPSGSPVSHFVKAPPSDPRHTPPSVPSLSLPSPSSFVFPPDILSSASPVMSTLTPERGSMPPPASTATSARSENAVPKKGDRAGSVTVVATKRKKDAVAKAPAKPKQPAKPRGKPGPKPKLKIIPSASTSAPVAKGSKGSGAASTKKSASVSIGASRSRSASAMPGGAGGSVGPEGDTKMDVDEGDGEGEDVDTEDDKLYCVCKTRYDEDKVMIACDICDGWYHTQCVNMPDLEVDLVDQFICPPCVEKSPDLSLKTTYKRRCLLGLKHRDPSSPEACHKPARGAFSKYCSDECGVNYMQANIEAWTTNGGKKERLWESVEGAEKREGVVVCADPPKDVITKVEVTDAIPKKGKVEREVQRLNAQLDEAVRVREEIKGGMEIVLWRKRLLELATERADNVDQCGWDQRLCFGDEEWADFGAGALESYEERMDGVKEDAMAVDSGADGENAWWCVGKKKCERHAGWQGLRAKDIAHEIEKKEESLLKLTTQEREIRKRIEDIVDHGRNSNENPSNALMEASNNKPPNDIHAMKMNGDQVKKGKKRKVQT